MLGSVMQGWRGQGMGGVGAAMLLTPFKPGMALWHYLVLHVLELLYLIIVLFDLFYEDKVDGASLPYDLGISKARK